jgi:hypothetical protein
MHGFVGPCCTGPTGKLHSTAKLAVLEAVAEEGKLDSTLSLNGGVDGDATVAKGEITTANSAETTAAVVEKEHSNTFCDVKTDNPQAERDGVSDTTSVRGETGENCRKEDSKQDRPLSSSSGKTSTDKKGEGSPCITLPDHEDKEEKARQSLSASLLPLSQSNSSDNQSIIKCKEEEESTAKKDKSSDIEEASLLPPPPEFLAVPSLSESNEEIQDASSL